ncbi:DUF2871 domain-containing protein [Clostridium thermobutyricum]|uniref:DUF2871 domain-containing protein n=1 Tax=Clostridium thermobutyricum DSM 4928 TaxID=1121339 RepID=A0A1V4SYW0_9CLOT|nr:DUF2871 domain-containing protein [Clostridium thermobutyricum]OPX49500.1 hypothetical protein CLTHE_05970 [Clostridium thermobutyricum DSM 4928]
MKKIFYTAISYLLLGLASGVFYRKFTVLNNFTGNTQLKVAHTHILILGFLIFLMLTLFERVFNISKNKWFNKFFVVYNIGLILTTVMFFVIGIAQVKGNNIGPAMNGISGLGHVIITVGFVFLFMVLKDQLFLEDKEVRNSL